MKDETIETPNGTARAVTYRAEMDTMQHLAIVYGDIGDGTDVMVRLQIESVLDDTFGAAPSLHRYLKRIANEGGCGVLVYLREGSVGVAREASPRNEAVAAFGEEREAHGTAKSRKEEWLEIGLGAQILRDLGVRTIRLLASRERHYVGVEGFGIEIVETVTD